MYSMIRRVSATELARNLRQILDSVEFRGEQIVIVRNKRPIARILPGPAKMTALEAMADLYRTLPSDAAEGWIEDSRAASAQDRMSSLTDPWDS